MTLKEAEDKVRKKGDRLDRDLRAAKYTLFEKYSKMIEEAICDENISEWNARRESETPVEEELIRLLNIDASEQFIRIRTITKTSSSCIWLSGSLSQFFLLCHCQESTVNREMYVYKSVACAPRGRN